MIIVSVICILNEELTGDKRRPLLLKIILLAIKIVLIKLATAIFKLIIIVITLSTAIFKYNNNSNISH
jgi:hypothetical protein